MGDEVMGTRAAANTGELFTNRDLRNMIIPLLLEQLLVMLVGIADTLIISYAGEAAVSGVALVNQFNTIFIYIFTALAGGGAVVISQYIGRGENNLACVSASQLLMFSALFSAAMGAAVLLGRRAIFGLLFGQVEPDVMDACMTYSRILAFSYPAIAIYNAGAAVYRSMGRTNVTMYISFAANVINVSSNLIGVFLLHAGVAGVAYPSLIAHCFSAVTVTVLCFRGKRPVHYRLRSIFAWDASMLKNILRIAIPNSAENGVFQLVKVALTSIVALFGTSQIAANGVAQTLWSLSASASNSMGTAYITVIGRCMGAGDTDAADFYFKKLTKWTILISTAWNAVSFAITPIVCALSALEPETQHLVLILVLIHNLFNAFVFPFSGGFSNGLRAAGDVKYTMYVTIFSTIVGRLALSYLFCIVFDWQVIGVALAMCCDWVIRAVLFIHRQRLGKWKNFKVI